MRPATGAGAGTLRSALNNGSATRDLAGGGTCSTAMKRLAPMTHASAWACVPPSVAPRLRPY